MKYEYEKNCSTIQELIDQLQLIKREHGNLPIECLSNSDGDTFTPNEFYIQHSDYNTEFTPYLQIG